MPVPSTQKRTACDRCRLKRVRCNAQETIVACAPCALSNQQCTFSQRRPASKSYAQALERRVAELEKLVQKLQPHAQFLNTDDDDTTYHESKEFLPGVSTAFVREFATKIVDFYGDDPASKAGDGTLRGCEPGQTDERLEELLILPEIIFPAAGHSSTGFGPIQPSSQRGRRVEFWKAPSWEHVITADRAVTYSFPEDDLIMSCTNIFFEKLNIFIPVLHRPMFVRSLEDKQHLRDHKFGALVLLVCAIGSWFSDDPRALADGETSPLSNGWKWFNQIDLQRRAWLSPTICDLQILSLSVFFIKTCSTPAQAWTLMGVAVRLAQDLGGRLGYPLKAGEPPTVESELWKRAWWSLVVVDRLLSSSMGRPCATCHYELDVTLPVECDDEFWETEDSEQMFKQPAGKPAITSCFVQLIKLSNLTALTLGTVYKCKHFTGAQRSQYEEFFVTALDSALTKWKENLPEHLQWNPNRKPADVFFDQSFVLIGYYYHLQILIHRPFIPTPSRPPSPLSAPSLAICTNAARSCCKAAQLYEARRDRWAPGSYVTVFESVVILLVHIWLCRNTGTPVNTAFYMTYVHDFLQNLEAQEKRWTSAGQCRDILMALLAVEEAANPPESDTAPVQNAVQDMPSSSSLDSTTDIPMDEAVYDSMFQQLKWPDADDPSFSQLQTLLDLSYWGCPSEGQALVSDYFGLGTVNAYKYFS